MNPEQVRKASEALDSARAEYQKAAKELLAAVEATPAEIEEANKIIDDDFERTGGDFPYDALNYEQNLATTILEEVRTRRGASEGLREGV